MKVIKNFIVYLIIGLLSSLFANMWYDGRADLVQATALFSICALGIAVVMGDLEGD